jgi:hypothetical protein
MMNAAAMDRVLQELEDVSSSCSEDFDSDDEGGEEIREVRRGGNRDDESRASEDSDDDESKDDDSDCSSLSLPHEDNSAGLVQSSQSGIDTDTDASDDEREIREITKSETRNVRIGRTLVLTAVSLCM